VTIVDNFKSDNNIIENEGGKLFIETFECAQQTHRYCGCQQPKPENWKISLQKTENVLSPSTGGGYFFANYMKMPFH
jgi:prolyl oligopeptidase